MRTPTVCSMTLAALMASSASAADFNAPAEFTVNTTVINPDLIPVTATIAGAGTGLVGFGPDIGTTWLSYGYEPFIWNDKLYVNSSDPDVIADTQAAVSGNEGYWDGATARVYRVVDGVFTKVREGTIPDGGHLNSGFEPQYGVWSDTLIDPSSTTFEFAVSNWSRIDAPYYFTVCAVANDGSISAYSNWVSATPGAYPGKNDDSASNNEIEWSWPNDTAPTDSKGGAGAPGAPTNLQAIVASTGKITLNWDASPTSGIAGYNVYTSSIHPNDHQGHLLTFGADGADLQNGDMVFLRNKRYTLRREEHRTFGNWNGAGSSVAGVPFQLGEIAGGDWELVPHPTPLPADFTDAGETCLRVDLSTNEQVEIKGGQHYAADGDYYDTLLPGTTYVCEVWLRQEGLTTPVTFKSKSSYHTIGPVAFEANGTWQKFTHSFTVSEQWNNTVDQTPTVGNFFLTWTGPGTLWIDNWRIYEQDDGFCALRQTSVDNLTQAKTSFLRTHSTIKSGAGYSIDTLINPPGATEYSVAASRDPHTLSAQFGMMQQIGANPWIQIEMYHSEEEFLALAEFLAAPYNPSVDTPQSKPHAYKRYLAGRQAPWTDAFDRILWETSNEVWNSSFAPWITLGEEMFDSVSNVRYQNGELLGLIQAHITETLRSSPYWTQAVEDKVEWVIGGRIRDDFGQEAVAHFPEADWVTIANYNGGWESGNDPATADDEGIFKAMTQPLQDGLLAARKQARDMIALQQAGSTSAGYGTYEAGPGYGKPGDLSGDALNQQNASMKSLGVGMATLDSFLGQAAMGAGIQNFFCYSHGTHGWVSHQKAHVEGSKQGQPYASWLGIEMFNQFGTGDMLLVDCQNSPGFDLPNWDNRNPMADAPMSAVYAMRDGDRYSVFCLSRKIDNYPVTGDDGYTPMTLNLPFTMATGGSITLYTLTGDPRDTNIDSYTTTIDSYNIPLNAFQQTFVIDEVRGLDGRGLPPGSVFAYVFEGTSTAALQAAPQASILLPRGQSDTVTGNENTSVVFRVRFDRPVTGFGDEPGDVQLLGSAGATWYTVSEVEFSGGALYEVEVGGFTAAGDVWIRIPAGAAQAIDSGNDNAVSTAIIDSVAISFPDGLPLLMWELGDAAKGSLPPDGSTYQHPFVQSSQLLNGPNCYQPTWAGYTDEFQVASVNTAALDPDAYISWTVQADSGYQVSLQTIRMFLHADPKWSHNEANFALAVSNDGFLTSNEVPLDTAMPVYTDEIDPYIQIDGDCSGITTVQNQTGAIECRLFIWGLAESYHLAGLGHNQADGVDLPDLIVMGSASSTGASDLTGVAQWVHPERMQLQWNAIADTDFSLARRKHPDADNQVMIALLPSGTVHLFDDHLGSLPVLDYRYDIQAFDSSVNLLTEDLDILPIDMGLSQQASGSGILVDWNDILDADWYFLQRSKPSEQNTVMGIFLPLDPSEYQDDGASPTDDPDYAVSAGGQAVLGNG